VTSVVSVGEDLEAAGLSAAQLARVSVVYLGTHANPTSEAAKVVVPTLTVFEKHGTFVNQQFRIQRFAKAVPGVAGATDDLVVLARIVAGVGGPALGADVGTLWKTIASEVPALGTMNYGNLPDTGLLLDATPWAGLPFAEGPSLHYVPPAPTGKEAARV
jgi:NADH-quinone oxidoreductase subunit G